MCISRIRFNDGVNVVQSIGDDVVDVAVAIDVGIVWNSIIDVVVDVVVVVGNTG